MPDRSMTCAPAGIARLAPIAVNLPPCTRMTWLVATVPDSGSTSRPARMAVTGGTVATWTARTALGCPIPNASTPETLASLAQKCRITAPRARDVNPSWTHRGYVHCSVVARITEDARGLEHTIATLLPGWESR